MKAILYGRVTNSKVLPSLSQDVDDVLSALNVDLGHHIHLLSDQQRIDEYFAGLLDPQQIRARLEAEWIEYVEKHK